MGWQIVKTSPYPSVLRTGYGNKRDAERDRQILGRKDGGYGYQLSQLRLTKMPKKTNPETIGKGKWVKVKAVKFNKDGSVSIMK